MPDTDN